MKIEIVFFFGLRNCSFLWEGKVDHDKGMVNDVEAVWNLGGREMLSCLRERISVFVVVVGVVELMMMVQVITFGVVAVDCSEVVDTFVLGGDFVVVVVEVELVMG